GSSGSGGNSGERVAQRLDERAGTAWRLTHFTNSPVVLASLVDLMFSRSFNGRQDARFSSSRKAGSLRRHPGDPGGLIHVFRERSADSLVREFQSFHQYTARTRLSALLLESALAPGSASHQLLTSH